MFTVAFNQLCCFVFTAGQDFILFPREALFPIGTINGNGVTTGIYVLDDLKVEGTESLTLSGSVAPGAPPALPGVPPTPSPPPASFVGDQVTVDILDDDSKFVLVELDAVQQLIIASVTEHGCYYNICTQ